MHRINLLISTLFTIIIFTSLSLHAKIYTWVDENGKTHYSDQPVHTENVSTITPKITSNVSTTVSKNEQWQQDYDQAKQAKADQAQKTAKLDAKKKRYCDALKSDLAAYSQGGRMYTMTPDGERHYPSDKEVNSKVKEYTKLIKKNCR